MSNDSRRKKNRRKLKKQQVRQVTKIELTHFSLNRDGSFGIGYIERSERPKAV